MISTLVSVHNTATLVVPKDDKPLTVYIHNSACVTIYLGVSNVTTSNGFHLGNGQSQELFVPTNETLYGIVAAGTHDLKVLTPDLD